MATRQVVMSECDRCHTTEVSDYERQRGRRDKLVLPQGWLNVSGNTATSTVFDMDLCGDCKMAVLNAAGAAHFGRK